MKYFAFGLLSRLSFLVVVILLLPGVLVAGSGDIDGSGSINQADVVLLENHLSGRALLSGDALTAADLNGNAQPDVGDLITLSRKIRGLSAAVPRVVYEGRTRAESLIVQAGFAVGSVTMLQSESYPGTVVGQFPAGGTGAPPGSAVDLFVAAADGARIEISPTSVDLGTGGTTATFHVNCIGDESLLWYTGLWLKHTASPSRGVGDGPINLTIDRSRLIKGTGTLPFFVAPDVSGSSTPVYAYLSYEQLTDPAPEFEYMSSRTPFSPGDTITVGGSRFAAVAENNEVLINGQIVTASAVSLYPPRLTFTVPEDVSPGMVSFQAKRLSDSTWGSSSWGPVMKQRLVAPTEIELSPGRHGNNLWIEPSWQTLMETMTAAEIREWSAGAGDWVLGATNLEFTDGAGVFGIPAAIRGTFENQCVLEAFLGGETWYLRGKRLNNREVAIFPVPLLKEKEAFYALLKPGTYIPVRLWVSEKDTIYPRASNWIHIIVSSSPPPIGSVFEVSAMTLTSGNFRYVDWTPETVIQVAVGSTMLITAGNELATLEAPGLWGGSFSFVGKYNSQNGLERLPVVLKNPGTYTIRNVNTGASRTVEVLADGAPWRWNPSSVEARLPGGFRGVILPQDEDRTLFFNGATFHVPAGALPQQPGWLNLMDASYTVLYEGGYALDDPEVEDNRVRVAFSFMRGAVSGTERPVEWEPDGLLRPITVSAPYSPEQALNGPPSISALDEASGIYWALPCETDGGNRRVSLTFPAKTYGPPSGKKGAEKTFASAAGFPPVRLYRITTSLGIPWIRSSRAVIQDSENRFAVDYITDRSSSSYVSHSYAQGILNTMLDTWDNLAGQSWRTPDGMTTVYLRKSLIFGGYGSTTKAVFGRPTVTINIAECPMGTGAYYTTASHEAGHVFQREYTTNIIAKWFDEATAEWIALDTVGDSRFMKDAVNDAMPFTSSLPSGFTFGFDMAQSYAASPWAVWLEKNYSGSVREIYEALDSDPLVWEDHHGAVEDACGKTIGTLYRDFARDYWLQNFEPMPSVDLNFLAADALGEPVALTMTNSGDISFSDIRGALSSVRFSIQQNEECLNKFAGRAAVIRVTPGPDSSIARVSIFGDRYPATTIPDNPVELGVLNAPEPGVVVLDNGTAHRTWRFILANGSTSRTFPVTVRAVYPQINTLSPSSGRYSGGYIVNVVGTGFGGEQGSIRISGSEVEIVSWTDLRVRFRMPDVGEYTTSAAITVRTKENVPTNPKTFTFTK